MQEEQCGLVGVGRVGVGCRRVGNAGGRECG